MNYGQLDLFGTADEKQTIAERIMQYGIKGLGDRELIEGLISPYLSVRMDSSKLADTILAAMDKNRVFTKLCGIYTCKDLSRKRI